MVKSIGCPHVEGHLNNQTTTIHALIGRLELYVEEFRWKGTDLHTKKALYTIICQIEKAFKKGLMKHWNIKRNEIAKTKCAVLAK
jgi:hypothetical protein